MATIAANVFLPSLDPRLGIVRVTLIVLRSGELLLLGGDVSGVTHLEVSQQGGSAGKLQFTTLVWAEEDRGQGDILPTVLQDGGS